MSDKSETGGEPVLRVKITVFIWIATTIVGWFLLTLIWSGVRYERTKLYPTRSLLR